jgi:hypothetical protein
MDANHTYDAPPASPNYKGKMSLKKAITILAIALAFIGLVYAVFHGYLNLRGRVDKTRYTYQNTKAGEYSTVNVGGLNFSKPSEFSSVFKKTDDKYDIAAFTHSASTGYPIGYLMVISFKDSLPSKEKYIHDVNAIMATDSKNQQHVEYISGIKKQVFDSYKSAGYSVNLAEPHKFTNDSIKENAWSFDLTTTNSNPKVLPMHGKLIYALAPGNFYYFSVMAVKNNWTPNLAAWQFMINSLKINR